MKKIESFRGDWEVFSNFSLYPVFGCDTVEHWFQSMKALDMQERQRIRLASTPGEAKRLGRACECRPDWMRIRRRVMRMAIIEKFAPGTDAAEQLDLSGNAILIEGNTWHDNFWGDCRCGTRKACNKEGANMLGGILMDQRKMLRSI